MHVLKATVQCSVLTGLLASGQLTKNNRLLETNVTPCHSKNCMHSQELQQHGARNGEVEKFYFTVTVNPLSMHGAKATRARPAISQLIRTLLFIAATHDFNMNIIHIAGVDNTCADLLSRGQVQRFLEFQRCTTLRQPSLCRFQPKLGRLAQNILAHASLTLPDQATHRQSITSPSSYNSTASNCPSQFHPDTLCLWMADSIDKLTYSSIRNYLHGIATTHVELGYSNPLKQSPLLWRMFKAIKRIQGEQAVRKRLPITVKILSQIDSFIDTSKQEHLCMRAAMWLGTCGLLRSGEFTRKPTTKYTLKLNHLTFHAKDNSIVDPLNTAL